MKTVPRRVGLRGQGIGSAFLRGTVPSLWSFQTCVRVKKKKEIGVKVNV